MQHQTKVKTMTQISYCEARRQAANAVATAQPVDWNWYTFLNQKSFTEEELLEAVRYANSWTTCAVGHQCNVIRRNHLGTPLDDKLAALGYDFYQILNDALYGCKNEDGSFNLYKQRLFINIAKQLLDEIEIRSKYLIEQYYSNNKRTDV